MLTQGKVHGEVIQHQNRTLKSPEDWDKIDEVKRIYILQREKKILTQREKYHTE